MREKRITGFTLIEMLVASALAAVLIGADLTVMARLGKDRNLIAQHTGSTSSHGLTDLLYRDCSQSESIDDSQQRVLVMTGHCSISRATLLADQRWARVTYRIINSGGRSSLWRSQEYLDDPSRPEQWREWVGDGVTDFSLHTSDAPAGTSSLRVETGAGGFVVEWQR